MCRAFFLCFTAVITLPAIARAQLADPIPGPISQSSISVRLDRVADGLNSPVWATDAGDDSGRLFVVDQSGQIRIIQNGALVAQPFLNVAPGNSNGLPPIVALDPAVDERGLLGLAFHPGFATAASPGFGKLYTYTSEPVGRAADFPLPVAGAIDHQSVVREWTVDSANPNQINPASVREILRVDQPQANHNAGALTFGPDNLLYVAFGDGGAADDQGPGHVPGGNAQDANSILGSIIRIDVNGDDFPAAPDRNYAIPATNPFVGAAGLDEAFAIGFRNPYRMSFDGTTGQLIAGDVGQNDIEEIDIVTAGANYGWAIKEGTFLFNMNGANPGFVSTDSPGAPVGLTDPVLQYDHDEGLAVIGGFVYRGSALPNLAGKYIFGELMGPAGGRLFAGDLATGDFEELTLDPAGEQIGQFAVKGFGQDGDGELFVLGSVGLGPFGGMGVVLQIVPEPTTFALLAVGSAVVCGNRRRFGARRGTNKEGALNRGEAVLI
jgi:glucose/arabinose dehydrogenase